MCKYKTLGYTGLFSLHIERPSYFAVLQRVPDGYFKENNNFPRFQRVQHLPGGVQLFQGGGGPSGNFYRNPYNLWFSRGGGPEPLSPPLNPHMIACKCKLLFNKFKTESELHTGRCINYIIRKIWRIDVTWLLAGRRGLIMVLPQWVLWNVLSTAISSYHTAV